MNSGAGPGPSTSPFDEFTVRMPRDGRRKFTMMKFGTGSSVDFAKVGEQSVKIERENNLREYKSANDIDQQPKFGAGSEYGRDLKEESRRKKYGIMLKRYDPDNQPWLLKIGAGKQAKKFKGVREGSISENTSYYIFTKAADGAFEAFPVEEWYNFSPIVRYKYLNSEEAEEEFNRRDKTLNYFNIMLKKRYKKDDNNADEEEEEDKKKKKGGKGGKKKNLQLTDMEDWDDLEMSEDDDSERERDDDDDADGKGQKKKKGKPTGKKKKKSGKHNSDDEAIEESDDGDYDDKEVDYMSDSGSDSSFSGGEKETKGSKYDDKGVDQEAGLRNILDSDAEDEEEEETQKDEAEDDVPEKEDKKGEKKKGEDDSSSSSSEDDSDIEKDANKLASELFLPGDKKLKKEKKEKPEAAPAPPETSVKAEVTPSPEKQKEKAVKRKPEKSPESKPPSLKKHKSEDSESITEDDLRRYLLRKPMTTKELLMKFKGKKLNMTNEKIQQVIVQLLKKINPERKMINKKLYLFLKEPESQT